jgi:DNA-binding transcriptional MocR family regulator
MHLTLGLPKPFSDIEIANRAARQNVWTWPLSPNYYGSEVRQGLLLGFGGVAKEDIPRGVRQLRRVIEGN